MFVSLTVLFFPPGHFYQTSFDKSAFNSMVPCSLLFPSLLYLSRVFFAALFPLNLAEIVRPRILRPLHPHSDTPHPSFSFLYAFSQASFNDYSLLPSYPYPIFEEGVHWSHQCSKHFVLSRCIVFFCSVDVGGEYVSIYEAYYTVKCRRYSSSPLLSRWLAYHHTLFSIQTRNIQNPRK